METIPHSEITYKIIGCAMRVHNELGPGLKEGIYQRALAAELDLAGLTHEEEKVVQVNLDGRTVGLLYIDHYVQSAVVVELKALRHKLTNDEIGQLVTYLAVTGDPVGLLINFGGRSLEYRRILPPMKLDAWRDRIRRHVWMPPNAQSAYPLKNPL